MPLLEREGQFKALDAALKAAKEGQGCVALVAGEAGIGKSSLVQSFVKDRGRQWRILEGACDSLFTPRPLGPLHDIAARTGGKLQELLERRSDRGTVFSACLGELGSQATILIIEDIHWADEATLDLIKYLGRRVRQIACLIILTYRDDELAADHPLRQVLGDLGTSGSLRRVPVEGLSLEAVGELARGKNVAVDELYRLTNGNPFFVTEVLAVERMIPETVRDAVLARAARLTGAGRSLLEVAATIGFRGEAWLLAKIANTADGGLEDCLGRGMLRAEGNGYAFRHELARQTIVEATLPQRRIDLHGRVLAALESTEKTRGDLARLASHAEEAGDAAAILKYAPAAAKQASEAGAHRQAARLYEVALKQSDGLAPAEHAEMLETYVLELWYFSPKASIVPVSQEAIQRFHSLGDRRHEGLNLALIGSELMQCGRSMEAKAAVAKSIEILESLPPGPELARAYGMQSYFLTLEGRYPECIAPAEKAMALGERFGDLDVYSRAANLAGENLILMGDPRGETLMERSLGVAKEHELDYAIGMALVNWALALVWTRQFEKAERVLQEGIAYARAHDDDYHLAGMLPALAEVRLSQGRYEDMAELIRQAMDDPTLRAMMSVDDLRLGGARDVRQGRPGGQQRLREALDWHVGANDREMVGTLRALLAEAYWLNGDLERAVIESRADYDFVEKQHVPWELGELAFWRWRAGEHFTPPDWIAKPYGLQIAGNWREAAREWERLGCPYERGMALMDGDEQAQLEAVEIFTRLGAKPILEKLKQKMRAEGVRGIPRGPRPATRENPYGLTGRELEVLARLVKGASNSAIARELSLSTRTVEHHIASILQKTGTGSRAEAVALALKSGMVAG